MQPSDPVRCPNCHALVSPEAAPAGPAFPCPHCEKPIFRTRPTSDRETYNIVTDLGTGVNVRLRDNLLQAAAIVICLILGALVGLLVASERIAGVLIGGFLGMVLGLFASGIFLMIYRFLRHLGGHHD